MDDEEILENDIGSIDDDDIEQQRQQQVPSNKEMIIVLQNNIGSSNNIDEDSSSSISSLEESTPTRLIALSSSSSIPRTLVNIQSSSSSYGNGSGANHVHEDIDINHRKIQCCSLFNNNSCSIDKQQQQKTNENPNIEYNRKKKKKQKQNLEHFKRTRTYWNAMPIDILERIFELLSIKERHVASQVCPHWFECFYSPSIWTTLILTDSSFTKRKFNYYLGYQRMIDPFKTQIFLQKFGHNLRRLIIKPMSNFFNLYEFMKILSQFAQHYEPNQLRNLYSFDFTFGCYSSNLSINDVFDQNRRASAGDIRNAEGDIIGTGGKLLEALKELMLQLIGLKHLALRDLLLNVDEAQYLLENVAINCYDQLRSLTLINCCKNQCAFLHTGIFINLETLVISCQHLDEDVLMLLAYNRLNHLYIVQSEVTRSQGPLSALIWRRFCKVNTHTQIHLVMVNKSGYCNQNPLNYELALQQTRVSSIIYDAPIIRPVCARLMEVSQLYWETLQCVAFYHIPKFSIRKSYVDRIDTPLIHLSKQCPRLRTIIINDLISTATLLLMVSYARNLTKLLVRRNAIRKRFDCMINPEWRESFVQWLRSTSRSYEMTFIEVSRMLGYKWTPLSDDQFKRIKPDVKL